VIAAMQLGTFQELLAKVQEKDPALAAAIDNHLKSELASSLAYLDTYSKEGSPDTETWMKSNADLYFVVESLLYQIYESKSALSLCDGDILIHAGLDAPSKAPS
jgi:hypothetical protein